MIFRRPDNSTRNSSPPEIRPVWQVFLETQKSNDPPYGIVFQAEHARLAGELAEILSPDVFGPLPPEVVAAIAGHDAGWQSGDEAQLRNMAESGPKPFPLLPGEESVPFWNESVRLAEAVSPLTGVIVSRHFCALSVQDPSHRSFLEKEEPRRERLERGLAINSEDLDRWTAAIGFCDVLSLYLCCGTRQPARFPLAHPALPDSRNARTVFLEWEDDAPQFSLPVIDTGKSVSLNVKERRGEKPELLDRGVAWRFGQAGA